MGQLDAPPDPADEGVLGAPVELKGFALLELQWNESAHGNNGHNLMVINPVKNSLCVPYLTPTRRLDCPELLTSV